jgi:hypothetical protein
MTDTDWIDCSVFMGSYNLHTTSEVSEPTCPDALIRLIHIHTAQTHCVVFIVQSNWYTLEGEM